MIQKTKKRLAFALSALLVGLFGGFMQKNFNQEGALFTGINVAHADIPVDASGNPDYSAGSDSGCSGCDSY